MDERLKKFERSYLAALVGFLAITGVIGMMIFHFGPWGYFQTYPLILLTFFIFGAVLITIITRCEKRGKSATKPFLLFKVIKFLVSIAIIFVYFWVAKSHIQEFAITYLAFYFLYIIFETTAIARYERLKKMSRK